jgi:hypothetical protein
MVEFFGSEAYPFIAEHKPYFCGRGETSHLFNSLPQREEREILPRFRGGCKHDLTIRNGFVQAGEELGSLENISGVDSRNKGFLVQRGNANQAQFLESCIVHAASDETDIFMVFRPDENDGIGLLQQKSDSLGLHRECHYYIKDRE